MKRALLQSMLLLGFAQSVVAAGSAQWTWEAGKQTNNGSVTVKSVTGSSTYSGTQNPTGAAAKTNQIAVTQPPTVIIQATGGGTTPCIAMTRNAYAGNLGGRAGGDAICAGELGAGWRFGTLLDVGACARLSDLAESPWVDNYVGSGNNNCNLWSTSAPGVNGMRLNIIATPDRWGRTTNNCSQAAPLVCAKY